MSIYITQQQKAEWEAKLEALESEIKWLDDLERNRRDKSWDEDYLINETEQTMYKELLSKAIVLPVEESWEDTLSNTEVTDCIYSNKMNYPNGVIIKEKFDFGYSTNEGCELCGKTPAQIEPRFGYTSCQEHSKLSPVEFSNLKQQS